MKPEEKALQLQKTTQEITEESAEKMVCQDALKSSLITYQDVKSLKDTLYRERLKLRPKLPTCKEEVLETLMRMDIKDYNFSICKSNKEYGIALLTTEESLLFLSNSHRMLSYGTFKSCSKFFFQLYTLNAFQNGRFTPCVFCLLPDKTTYEKMLEMLLETTREFQIELCP